MSGSPLSSQFDCGSTRLKGSAVIKQLDEMSKEELFDELHHAHRWQQDASHELEIATARIVVINSYIAKLSTNA